MNCLLIEPNQPPQLVNVTWDDMKNKLGWIEITHPFEDDAVVLINDEDGCANQRLPNRTINGCIIPGPFYVARFNSSDDLIDLLPSDIKLYSEMFSVPEHFAADGQWRLTSYVEERPHVSIVHVVSAWITETGGGKK